MSLQAIDLLWPLCRQTSPLRLVCICSRSPVLSSISRQQALDSVSRAQARSLSCAVHSRVSAPVTIEGLGRPDRGRSSGGNGSGGEPLSIQTSLPTQPPLTSCCWAWLLTGRSLVPVPAQGLGPPGLEDGCQDTWSCPVVWIMGVRRMCT